jgi:hypothetical protein
MAMLRINTLHSPRVRAVAAAVKTANVRSEAGPCDLPVIWL